MEIEQVIPALHHMKIQVQSPEPIQYQTQPFSRQRTQMHIQVYRNIYYSSPFIPSCTHSQSKDPQWRADVELQEYPTSGYI